MAVRIEELMYKEFKRELLGILNPDTVMEDEPMKKHTTFRAGGKAEFFLEPAKEEELVCTVNLCRKYKVPFIILGNGSNFLVRDNGIAGAVIHIGKNLEAVEIKGNDMEAQAGALLSQIARKAAESSLSGMEFAAGIPGSLGGAIAMNAGAYGGEMKQIVKNVRVLTDNGRILTIEAEDMEFGYRHSMIEKTGCIVLSARLCLKKGSKEAIFLEMKELLRRRKEKQPLEYASAGSTFKRPAGHFAGQLIMEAGLKGYRVGDAMVSEKHCGFVVNTGNASARDILDVMEHVKHTVWEKSGIMLEPEVKILGRD